MNDYVISCGSTADLTNEQLRARNIPYISFHFSLDGWDYADDMWKSISPKELYYKMSLGIPVKTSLIPVSEYLTFFEGFLAKGLDLLHVDFSSGLSGSYQSALLAAEELAEKYPERKIYIVDSLCASSGYGMLMDTLADMRDCGGSIEELHAWVEENKLRLHHWFFSTDLSFYRKGGRISKTAGMVGAILNICPLLYMDGEGRLKLCEKPRGKQKAMKRLVEMMALHAQNGADYQDKCYICHSMCPEDAHALEQLIHRSFPHIRGSLPIYSIGAAIGAHSGPGTLAVFFWGDSRQ